MDMKAGSDRTKKVYNAIWEAAVNVDDSQRIMASAGPTSEGTMTILALIIVYCIVVQILFP